MIKYLLTAVVLVLGEVLSFFVFKPVKIAMGPHGTANADKWSVAKGVLERLVILLGLLQGYPQILTAFGALKIGTRLHDQENDISNSYFLVGNLVSLLFTLIYAAAIKAIWLAYI